MSLSLSLRFLHKKFRMRVVYMFPCFLIFSTLLWSVALPSASQLALPAGLRLSLLDSYQQTPNGYYEPVSPNKTVAVPAYGGGFFFPILSTEAFTQSTPGGNQGFSFGFLFAPYNNDAQQASDIYLSVCIGKLGIEVMHVEDQIVYGRADSKGKPIKPSYTFDGFAMPVWIANLDRPLRSFKGSLMVDEVSKDLQMKDSNGSVVWNVTSVGMMEIKQTGNLLIYDSTNTSTIVWQSNQQPTDTLVANQPLHASMQLVSNASSFLIRMEPGGLVFYLNSEFPAALPYWVIPVINSMNVTESVVSPPCSDNSAYAYLDPGWGLKLVPGTCNNTYSTWIYLNNSWGTPPPDIVLKLENDGRAYLYTFDTNNPSRSDLGLDNGVLYYSMKNASRHNSSTVKLGSSVETSIVSGSSSTITYTTFWGSCDIPMACGPLSICTPHVEDPCTCPPSSEKEVPAFNAVDPNYMSQGCNRAMLLPPCGMMGGDNGSTNFLEIDRTGSIFLFSGWAYPNASLEVCKQSCASNCSCNGIVYDTDKSVCLPMGDKVSLLNVSNHANITGKNYVAYLKIAGPTSPSRRRISTPALVAIGIIITLVFCLVLGLVTYAVTIRRAKHILPPDLNQEEEDQLQDILPLLPSRFSYQDLHEATQAFSKLLGTGGCGSVYAGVLPDGRKVAVKRLESMATGHQSKTFLAEVAAIGRTSHHNIVRLVGFCLQLSSRLLVYEYVERGSLDQWLFKEAQDGRAMLDWATRYDVALGIARGLNYLHEDCPQPILHLDIKPQNILLDNVFVAKLADFGMSRVMERDMSQVVTGVRGTPGYIAPEWHLHGGVGKKCDVYSMGMVMLEMVAGRRNVDFGLLDTEASEQWHFPSWAARECEGGRMMELVDQRLQRAGVDEEQARRLMNAAFWCIQEDPSVRPSAFTVLQWLEGTVPFRQPPFSTASHVNSAAKPQSFSISLASFSGTH